MHCSLRDEGLTYSSRARRKRLTTLLMSVTYTRLSNSKKTKQASRLKPYPVSNIQSHWFMAVVSSPPLVGIWLDNRCYKLDFMSVLACGVRRLTSNSNASFIHQYWQTFLASFTLTCWDFTLHIMSMERRKNTLNTGVKRRWHSLPIGVGEHLSPAKTRAAL